VAYYGLDDRAGSQDLAIDSQRCRNCDGSASAFFRRRLEIRQTDYREQRRLSERSHWHHDSARKHRMVANRRPSLAMSPRGAPTTLWTSQTCDPRLSSRWRCFGISSQHQRQNPPRINEAPTRNFEALFSTKQSLIIDAGARTCNAICRIPAAFLFRLFTFSRSNGKALVLAAQP